jgi:hypothetical protein
MNPDLEKEWGGWADFIFCVLLITLEVVLLFIFLDNFSYKFIDYKINMIGI